MGQTQPGLSWQTVTKNYTSQNPWVLVWTTFPRGDSDSPWGSRTCVGFAAGVKGLPAWGRPRQHLGQVPTWSSCLAVSVPEHNTCCPRNPRRPGRGERWSVGDAGGRTGPREDAASGRGTEAQEARAGSSWVPAGRGRSATGSVFLAPPPPTDVPWTPQVGHFLPIRRVLPPCCFLPTCSQRATCLAPAGVLICSWPAVNVKIISSL